MRRRWALSCDGSVEVEFKTNRKGYCVRLTKFVHISVGSLDPSTHARSGRGLYCGAQHGSGPIGWICVSSQYRGRQLRACLSSYFGVVCYTRFISTGFFHRQIPGCRLSHLSRSAPNSCTQYRASADDLPTSESDTHFSPRRACGHPQPEDGLILFRILATIC